MFFWGGKERIGEMYHNVQGAVEAEFRRSANGSSSLVLKGSDVTVIFFLFLYITSSSGRDLVKGPTSDPSTA